MLLTPEQQQQAEAARLLLYIRKARAGDPFPLIRLQWGEELILDEFQIDILKSLFDPEIRKVWVKGNTGCGKGGAAAIAVCLYFQIWHDARVVMSRDSHKRAVKVLWAECKKWWRRMRYPPRANLLTEGAVDPENDQREVTVVNPGSDEGFCGVHAEHVLFLFDEATAPVLEDRFGLADTQATKFLALANPRTTSGNFRRAFTRTENWNENQTILGPYGKERLITVDGKDTLNVRLKRLDKPIAPPGGIEIDGHRYEPGETITPEHFAKRRPIIPGQTCYDTYMGHLHNPDPRWVAVMAHGHFPDEDPEKQLIRGIWIDAAVKAGERFRLAWARVRERNRPSLRKLLERWFPIEALGLDVGLSTQGDPTVCTVGGKRGVREQFSIQCKDVNEIVDWLLRECRLRHNLDLRRGGVPVAIDCDGGYGSGVASNLRKAGVRVIELKGNATSDVDPKKYANKRAENYGELAERLDPLGAWAGNPFILPPNELLRADLVAVEKLYTDRDGLRFRVTPKEPIPGVDDIESVKQKLGRSPDWGDSAVYFYRALQAAGYDLQKWLDAGAF